MADEGSEPTGLFDVKPKLGKGRMIRRRAYTRRAYTKKTGKRVKSSRVSARLIPDVGAPGKWKYEHMGAPGIGPLKKGDLEAVGYSVNDPEARRHVAVDAAVKKYGKLTTLRKLNAVAVYTRRTSPAKSRKFKADVRYVQSKF